MKKWWLPLLGLMLVGPEIAVGQVYQLSAWTPITADSDQSFVQLLDIGRKWQLRLRSSPEQRWVRIEVRRKAIGADGVERERRYWVRYDANQALLTLKAPLRRLDLSGLPKRDTVTLVIKSNWQQGELRGQWLFIEGARGYLWLSPFIKGRNSAIVKGEARVYRTEQPISLANVRLDSLADAWLISNGGGSALAMAGGQLLPLGGNQAISGFYLDSLWGRTMVALISTGDTNWLALDNGQPIDCGWRFKPSGQPVQVSSQWYLKDRQFSLIDTAGIWSGDLEFLGAYNQPGFQYKRLLQAEVVEVSDFGQAKAWLWPASRTITPVPDSIYTAKLGPELILTAKQKNFLAVVDSQGKLNDYSLAAGYELLQVRSRSLGEEPVLETGFASRLELDDDLLEVTYYDDRGRLDSSWLWPSQGYWSPDYGQPLLLSSDSIFIFKQGDKLLRVDKNWQSVAAMYRLKRPQELKLEGSRCKQLGAFRVLELDYCDGWLTGQDWLWLKPDGQIFISPHLGVFQGLTDHDSSLYVFLTWSRLALLSVKDWQWRVFNLDFYPGPLLTELADYSVIVYRSCDYQGSYRVMARLVCTKKVNGRWLYDRSFILKEE